MYCQFNAPHPSVTLSDWSSEDWDGKKAKAREQRPLLNFKLLEQQIQKTLQDTTQDAPQDTTQDIIPDKQETALIDRMKDLTLEQKQDMQNLTDILAPPLDAPKAKHEKTWKDNPTTIPMYNMTEQEVRLQCKEEEYRIYMSTFGYEGEDSNLDSKTDSDSNVTAYPFLE